MEQARLEAQAALLADRMWRRRDRSRQEGLDQVVTILGQIYDPSTGGVGGGAVPPLGGDVVGPIGANTVQGVRGRPYSASAPADGDTYTWDATSGFWVPGSAGAGHTIADEASALPARPALRFQGAGVTATDNAADDATDVVIPGGMTVREIDGAPSVAATVLEVTNGKLTDQGGGVARIDLSAAGSSLTVQEVDGSPTETPTTQLEFPNGTLTEPSAGVVRYTPAGGGGGGGGAATYDDPYATPPGTEAAGDLWLPSDAPYILRRDDADTAWVPWGPIFPLTLPVDADFAWINQGGATLDASKGSIFLRGPATAAHSFRIRKKAAPATPYTITACMLPPLGHPQATATSGHAGLLFRQSSDGKLHAFTWFPASNAAAAVIASSKWTSATLFSAHYISPATNMIFPPFWRLADDGTNRIVSVSYDGQNFLVIHTIGRTDFLTADEVGFYVSAPDTTYAMGLTLLSWKQA